MEKYEVIKFKDDEFEMDVNVSPNEETVWLTQNQLVLLFDTTKQNISLHINNIFKENELLKKATVKEILTVQNEGGRYISRKLNYYNLDMVLAIGYRVNSKRGILFRKWANKVLKQYLLNGYAINENRVVVSNENFIRLSNEVTSINNRLIKIEDKVFDNYDKHSILFNGQFYDAYTLIQSIFEEANKEIIIIDNYVDRTILDRLVIKKIDVNIIIYTKKDRCKLLDKDIEMFNKQYGSLVIKYTDKVHDRYIIIDQIKLYHLGASIKDLGKKIFSINGLSNELINILVTKL
ncbi:MAG: virulence RhuM family protein [Bacilli bacterium]|nr:virulence RhuM family protein [Bacilli bacterium]